jgi:hypothetical protein
MASAVPSSSILVTLMIEVLSSSKTSVLTRATQLNIPFFVVTAVKTSNLTSFTGHCSFLAEFSAVSSTAMTVVSSANLVMVLFNVVGASLI